MKRLAVLGRFMWDFVVGDDWRIAVAVAAAFAATALLSDAGVKAWWLLPPVTAAVLAGSILTVSRRAGTRDG